MNSSGAVDIVMLIFNLDISVIKGSFFIDFDFDFPVEVNLLLDESLEFFDTIGDETLDSAEIFLQTSENNFMFQELDERLLKEEEVI